MVVVAGCASHAIGTALQKQAVASRFPKLSVVDLLLRPAHVFASLLRGGSWPLGKALTVCGALAIIEALSRADLSVVVPLVNLSGVFAVMIGVLCLGERLRPREWLAVAVLLGGAALLGGELGESTHRAPDTRAGPVVAIVFIAASVWLARGDRIRAEVGLSIGSGIQVGLGNGLFKLAATAAAGQLDRDPATLTLFDGTVLFALAGLPTFWGFLVCSILGFVMLQSAFANGRIGVIGPVAAVASSLVGVVFGGLVLNESLGMQRGLGVVAMLIGTVLLARVAPPAEKG